MQLSAIYLAHNIEDVKLQIINLSNHKNCFEFDWSSMEWFSCRSSFGSTFETMQNRRDIHS